MEKGGGFGRAVVNEESMKLRSYKRITFLAPGLLLVLGLTCFLCVRTAQRQYALNRQLIQALQQGNTKEALTLMAAGADPNTRIEPLPAPTLPELVSTLLHGARSPINDSSTALMMACKEYGRDDKGISIGSGTYHSRLVKAMLLRGANLAAVDRNGSFTALLYAINADLVALLKQAGAKK